MVERRTRDREEEERDNFVIQGQFSVLTHAGIFFKRCFSCTQTRDREPRTATSIFTHFIAVTVYFKFPVALRPHRPYGLLGTGSSRRPPPLSHSSLARSYCQRRRVISKSTTQ